MADWIAERFLKLREFFELGDETELAAAEVTKQAPTDEDLEGLKHFNIEWHVLPAREAVAMDDSYFERLYPTASREFARAHEQGPSYRDRLVQGHGRHQGRILGVETTQKPCYLPGNRQFYGTVYGHDASADPFAPYMGRAGMMNGTRYDHNYLSLREFIRVVNEDWRERGLMPADYRATVCPPAIFNFVGTIFHPEWSETETLELGFYRDERGNATCYAVGSQAAGDFSFINEVEGEAEWSLMGFRVALVPEEK